MCVEAHVAAAAVGVRVFANVLGGYGGGLVVTGPRVVVRDVLEPSRAEGDLARFVLAETLLALGRVALDVV